MDEIKTFFNENNELLQSPTSDELIHPKIVGNYNLNRDDVCYQVIDWILHYLEDRKCPYQLAVTIANNVAQQIDSDITKHTKENVKSNTERLLNSVTLYTETIRKVPSVCNYFLEHEKGDEMLSSCSEPYLASVFAIKNKRRKMEDRHVLHHDLNLLLDLKDMPAQSYYAVFDGHGGVDAASYASAHLHVNIAKHPSFLTDTPTAVVEAYKSTDRQFLELCNKESIKSGSTVICALIREKTIYLSWLGDSQAVLVKGGKPAIVTNPHRPDREDEKKRIEDLGGHVSSMGVCRVNGVLSVTRALGDPDHKPYISNEPDVTVIHLDGKEDFLILGCDGLWDGMSPEDVTSALYHNLSESALDEPLDAVAAKLVHQSKLQGSEDNITAVVVFLRDIKEIKEYATELVHQSSSHLNYLGMNGEGNVLNAEGMTSTPFSKPTVLELNATSTKKLKNAANVLSSAGFTDPAYSCPYPGSAVEGLSYENMDSGESVFVLPPHLPPYLPPEATALSELPTPPIDDIVASQKFENLCLDDLHQGLNYLSSEQHESGYKAEGASQPTNVNSLELSKSMDFGVDPCIVSETTSAFEDAPVMKSIINDVTPDEAIGIASSVVSNTIETAVKCLSSSELGETMPAVSTQKLNPYAEPFVMRSFVPEDIQTHGEGNLINDKSNEEIPTELDTPKILPTESDKCTEISLDHLLGVKVDNCLIDNVKADTQSPLTDLENKSSILSSNPLDTSKEGLAYEFSLLDLKDPGSSYIAEVSEETSQLMDQNIHPSLEKNQMEDIMTNEPKKLEDFQDVCFVSSPDHKSVDNAFDVVPASDANSSEIHNLENTIGKDDIDALASSSIQMKNSGVNESSIKVVEDGVSLIPIKTEQDLPEKDAFILSSFVPENINESSNLEDSVKIKQDAQLVSHVLGEFNVDTTQNILEVLNTQLPSNFALEPEKSLPDASIILETGTNDSLTLLNIKDETMSSVAILPSDQVDDCHIETFAVDLQTVPDGIPEAEGVTEDVDSDSEKDGGWSYMKGNTVGSGKPKSNESTPKDLKSVNKPDSVSKLKKDVLKPTLDNKSKLKSAISVDKTKKPVEKKILDVKDRKPARVISSTLPKSAVEKSTKPSSIVSRVKKEPPPSKVTVVPASKLTRPAAPRNVMAVTKPIQNTTNTERDQAAATKAVRSTLASGNSRPKSALSPLATRANTRPGGISTLSKVQPSNQSNKSNVTSATRSATLNRPAASTVPSRVLTKPPLSKPASELKPVASESKPKQLPNTLKRTVPPAVKKPDVKEAKDIVNKQISAKTTLRAPSKTEVKSATNSNKYSAALNNKPLTNKVRTLKNDVAKKDVPKPTISKLHAKTTVPSKISRDITKGKVTKSTPIQEKKDEKISSGDNEQKAEITPVCEEEKFILEVNDKEVAVKEQVQTGVISDKMHEPVENGVMGENAKPLEEIVSNANSGSESLL